MCDTPEQYAIVDALKRLMIDEAKATVEYLELDLSIHTLQMEKLELRKFSSDTEALDMQLLQLKEARALKKTVLEAAAAAIASKYEELRAFKESRSIAFVDDPDTIQDLLARYLRANPGEDDDQPWGGILR